MHPDAQMPQVKTDGAAGADLAAVESCTVASGQVALVRTGIAMEIPQGYEGQVRSRSGISTAKQLILLNGIGTIDADYRGEIMVPVKNIGRERQEIEAGDRIAQLMIRPAPKFAFCWADELESTERGVGGFGSTGVN
ncbi:MAG: dUTP diphosphatase [Desulfobacteraceae bacterium]|nr:dUTP diphosphatase [Desulfobacteraceae bacterium]